jgi:hypothetical protein
MNKKGTTAGAEMTEGWFRLDIHESWHYAIRVGEDYYIIGNEGQIKPELYTQIKFDPEHLDTDPENCIYCSVFVADRRNCERDASAVNR